MIQFDFEMDITVYNSILMKIKSAYKNICSMKFDIMVFYVQ